jgi:hypothetical protein
VVVDCLLYDCVYENRHNIRIGNQGVTVEEIVGKFYLLEDVLQLDLLIGASKKPEIATLVYELLGYRQSSGYSSTCQIGFGVTMAFRLWGLS